MQAVVHHIRNPLCPSRDCRSWPVAELISVAEWLRREGLVFVRPTICLVNGDPVLRDQWQTTFVDDRTVVAFVTLPQGGGGSNPLRIVAMIAVVALASWVGAGGFGVMFLSDTALFMTEGAMSSVVAGAVVGIAGMSLVNAVLPPPTAPTPHLAQALASPSPTYNLGAQGNRARLGEAIPVMYGYHKIYPDFAADPYLEYEGNEQYLYQLFSLGQGAFAIDAINIEDTDINNFAEVETQTCGPGETVTLFPTDVTTSIEVSGQTMEYGTDVGPFAVNASGTTINKIGFDIVLPKGLFYANDDGGFDSRTVSWTMSYRPIDDSGSPTGAGTWTVQSKSVTMKTNTPQRLSYSYSVTAARYEAKVVRTSAPDTSPRSGNDIAWTGLRGYHPGDQQYGQTTVIAVKIRATDNLSGQSSRKVNVIATRKLQSWNPTTGWGTAAATRSIAWALADICVAVYGIDLADSRVNLQQLYDLDAIYTARGDTFDGIFDGQMVATEALTQVARAGRTMPYTIAGVVNFVRDQSQSIPEAMFTARNIVKGSLQIEYMTPSEDTADSVIVEYLDSVTWKPKTVTCTLSGSTCDNPVTVQLFGVISRDQVWREGMYIAAANRYRRKHITFQTELEGHIPTPGKLIAISHEIPSWGQSGELTGWDASGTYPRATVTTPLVFTTGETHYIGYRQDDGTLSGPHEVIAGVDEYEVVHVSDPGFTPYIGNDKERTTYLFGMATDMKQDAIVLSVLPRSASTVEIRATNERSEVHTADGGITPTDTTSWGLPATIDKPEINALSATITGTPENKQLTLSWTAAAGADHYLVQYTIDGSNWVPVIDCISTTFTFPCPLGAITVRVAPMGTMAGDWVEASVSSMSEAAPSDVQDLALIGDGTGTYWRVEWTAVVLADHYTVEVVADSVIQRTVTTKALFFEYRAEDAIEDGGPWRSATILVKAVNDAGSSENWATVVCGNSAPAALQNIHLYAGYLSAHFTYDKPADRDFAGVRVCMSETQGFTPGDGNVVFEGPDKVITIANLVSGTTYYFRLAAYDAYGTDDITYSSSEYSLTATSAATSLEVLTKLRESLTDPGMQSIDGDLIVNAERFAIRDGSLGADVYPLIVADGYVALSADVIINGTLAVSQLDPGELPSATYIDIASGTIRIDGSGSITMYESAPSDPPTEDFAFLSAGDLVFKRYRSGAYHEYKSVKRREQGTADSGDTVTIPGYWISEPRLLTAIAALQAYDASNSGLDQQWEVRADNLREDPADSGIWKFDAVSELTIAGGSGSTTVSLSDIGTAETWNSDEWNLPTGTTDLTVNVSLFSKKGTGVRTFEWYNRQVTWTVYGYYSGAWHALATGQTKAIGDQVSSSVSDSQTFDISSLSVEKCYVGYVAANVSGDTTFSTGDDQYQAETSHTIAANSDSFSDSSIGSQEVRYLTLDSWSLPTYAKLTAMDFTFNFGYDLNYVVNGEWTQVYVYDGDGTTFTYMFSDFGGQDDIDRAYASYNSGKLDRTGKPVSNKIRFSYQGGSGSIQADSPAAIVYYQPVVANSTTPDNQSEVTTMNWTATGATVLDTGSLVYLAVGD